MVFEGREELMSVDDNDKKEVPEEPSHGQGRRPIQEFLPAKGPPSAEVRDVSLDEGICWRMREPKIRAGILVLE